MTSNKGYGLTPDDVQSIKEDVKAMIQSFKGLEEALLQKFRGVNDKQLESSFGTSASDADPSADMCCDTSVTTNTDGQCWEGVDHPASTSDKCTPEVPPFQSNEGSVDPLTAKLGANADEGGVDPSKPGGLCVDPPNSGLENCDFSAAKADGTMLGCRSSWGTRADEGMDLLQEVDSTSDLQAGTGIPMEEEVGEIISPFLTSAGNHKAVRQPLGYADSRQSCNQLLVTGFGDIDALPMLQGRSNLPIRPAVGVAVGDTSKEDPLSKQGCNSGPVGEFLQKMSVRQIPPHTEPDKSSGLKKWTENGTFTSLNYTFIGTF